MKDLFFGWLTRGRCDVRAQDTAMMLVEICVFFFIAGCALLILQGGTKE